MQRFGALFSTASSTASGALQATSDPSSQFYSQSITTNRLQDFISHNWVTSRTEKFLCLALHYNLSLAICASWGTAALCCVLTLVGVFPVVVLANSIPIMCFASTLGSQVALVVTFFGAQDFWRLLRRLGFAGHGRLLFIDKACINQVDPALKRQGIENLAGFLMASQNIVVVYGPEYLYKLWTVYELATFVMAHRDHTRIKILPTMWLRQYGAAVVGFTLAHLLYYTALYTWDAPLTATAAYLVSAAFFCVLAGYFIRQWQRQLADITAASEAFSIRKTKCALESDRTQVQDNVRAFLLCLGRISAQSTEDALDEFDKLVREVLPRALAESLGPSGTPYSHAIACTSMFMGDALDYLSARTTVRAPWWDGLSGVVFYASACLTLLPLAVFLTQKILARGLHLRGCAEGLFVAVALLPGMGLYFIGFALERMASSLDEHGQPEGPAWPYRAALILYCALAAVATVAVYLPKSSWRAERPSPLFKDNPPAARAGVDSADPASTTIPQPSMPGWVP